MCVCVQQRQRSGQLRDADVPSTGRYAHALHLGRVLALPRLGAPFRAPAPAPRTLTTVPWHTSGRAASIYNASVPVWVTLIPGGVTVRSNRCSGGDSERSGPDPARTRLD